MEYRIYQLNDEWKREYGFCSYDDVKEDYGEPQREHYNLVYSFEIGEEITPDQLYEIFNLHRPEDFRGHSLSVSDVVYDGKYWYCDSFGWVELNW